MASTHCARRCALNGGAEPALDPKGEPVKARLGRILALVGSLATLVAVTGAGQKWK